MFELYTLLRWSNEIDELLTEIWLILNVFVVFRSIPSKLIKMFVVSEEIIWLIWLNVTFLNSSLF